MNKWQKVAEILKSGGVMILPSDSSYGIAAVAGNANAVERVYKIKKREIGKPSLLIVGSIEQARELVEFTPLAEELAQKYWPGGLTLVLNAKELDLPSQIYGVDYIPTFHLGGVLKMDSQLHLPGELHRTLAIRVPDKQQLRELALETGPFILPSANLAGKIAPYKVEEVEPKLVESVDFFLNEPTDGNPPSTLIDARGDPPKILREGPVIAE